MLTLGLERRNTGNLHGTMKVTGQDGVTRIEKKRINYWACDLGPRGRGRLRQTRISGFQTSTRGRRDENLTVGEGTLLGARTTNTGGQGSDAVTVAGIKKNTGE